jgi:hypothetical protein
LHLLYYSSINPEVLADENTAAFHYGDIRADFEKKGWSHIINMG